MSAASLPLTDPDLFRQQAFVAGQWVGADDGACIEVVNPADGTLLGSVPALGAGETRRAIEAAAAALPAWRARTAKERAALLRRWADALLAQRDDLALLLTLEQGKPLAEARAEIDYAAAYLEWFGEEAKRAYGELLPAHAADKRLLVQRQPVGVCAAITPWNFPTAMLARKLAPALAAGCTLVAKPSELTPYSAFALCRLGERAGLPPGVLSCLTGPAAPIGGELTANTLVRKLSFTGSTAVGKLLMAQCAGTVKKLSLELGGNAPFIVFDDADLDAAVAGALVSKYRNAGQTCVCANRLLVQDGVYDEFARRLGAALPELVVGDGRAPASRIGPLIDARALAKVERLVADALARGARLVGGGRAECGGNYYRPALLLDLPPDAACLQEEIFGPVAPLQRFGTEAEAIALANATPYGLAAYFYTRDLARSWRVSEALEYGIVGVNTGLISTELAPFGGMKESGLGREGSRHGLDEYLELKYVCVGGV